MRFHLKCGFTHKLLLAAVFWVLLGMAGHEVIHLLHHLNADACSNHAGKQSSPCPLCLHRHLAVADLVSPAASFFSQAWSHVLPATVQAGPVADPDLPDARAPPPRA